MANPSPNFRIGPGKLVFLSLLFLLAYGIALAVYLPAGWAWRWAGQSVQLPPGLQVKQVAGTVWHGQALVNYQRLPLQLDWRLQPSSIIHGRLPVAWSLSTRRSQLAGDLTVSVGRRLTLSATGHLYMADFAQWVRQQGGAQLAGSIRVDGLKMDWSDGKWEQAQGTAHWDGGLVTWPMGGRTQQATMPAMQAQLRLRGPDLDLTVARSGSQAPAAEVRLTPGGAVDLMVYRRLLDLAGQSWPDSVPAGAVVFRMRQQLLPGRS